MTDHLYQFFYDLIGSKERQKRSPGCRSSSKPSHSQPEAQSALKIIFESAKFVNFTSTQRPSGMFTLQVCHLVQAHTLLFKNGPFPATFFIYFCLFDKQLTEINSSIKVTGYWIRIRVLWYQKQPQCQLCHNHCHNFAY